MKVALVTTVLSLSLLVAAGCGGEDPAEEVAPTSTSPTTTSTTAAPTNVYHGDGYSFSYPSEWQEGSPAGVIPDLFISYVAFGPGPPNPRDGIEVKGISSAAFSLEDLEDAWSDAPGGYEELTDGPTRATVDGLPALRAEATYTDPETGDEYVGTLVMVFDERTNYLLECQYGRERSEEITPGCEQVFDSFGSNDDGGK